MSDKDRAAAKGSIRWKSGGNDYVGPYKVLKTIGAGSFAEVKVGQHAETNEKVALKVIEKSSIDNQKEATRERRYKYLRREIRYLKLLQHPNIVKLYEVLETDEVIVLIMEHISGGELKKEITRTEGAGMPEGRVRDLFRQICSAMMYLHSNNIVHRDLKPQNIMVTADHKTVKIIDFGFTNVFDEGDVLASFIGSPSYAAPEILQGIKYAGNKVDVWSLGVILYHMAVGVHPFTAKTMEQLYDRVISGRYTRIPNTVAPVICDLIKFVLNTNPMLRPDMEAVVRHEFFQGVFSSGNDLATFVIPRKSIIPTTQLDEEVVDEMLTDFGYELGDVQAALATPEESSIKNTYHLIFERLQRLKQAEFIKLASDKPHGFKKFVRNVKTRVKGTIASIVHPNATSGVDSTATAGPDTPDASPQPVDAAPAAASATAAVQALKLEDTIAATSSTEATAGDFDPVDDHENARRAEVATAHSEATHRDHPRAVDNVIVQTYDSRRRMTMEDVEDAVRNEILLKHLQDVAAEAARERDHSAVRLNDIE